MIEEQIKGETTLGKLIPQLSQMDLRRIVYYRQDIIAILQSIDQPEKAVEKKIGEETSHCIDCGATYLKNDMHSIPIVNHPHGVAFKCETCWNISIRA